MKKNIFCMVLILTVILSLFSVTVSAEKEKMSISDQSINLYINQSYQISVTGVSSSVVFYSEDTKIAEVSGDGTVIAKGLGSTVIVADANNGQRAECKVNVLNGVSPKDIVMSSQDITLKVGESYTIKAEVKPKETDQRLTFTVSDSSVIKVDQNGYIKALKPGVAVVTVSSTSDAVSKKCMVKVNANTEQEGANVSVKGALYSISGEKKTNMAVEIRNSSGFKRTVTDEDGSFSFTGIKQGDYAFLAYKNENDINPAAKAQISIGAYNLIISCIMNDSDIVILYQNNTAIASDITDIVLSSNSLSLKTGETYDMSCRAKPSNAVLPTVMGESEDEGIATVDAEGRITAVSEGKTTITFTTVDGRLSRSCKVTVSESQGNKYSWLIITIESALMLLIIIVFVIKYIKFIRNKYKEEFRIDEED